MKNFCKISAAGILAGISLWFSVLNAQPVLDNTFNGTGYHITKIDPSRDDIGGTVLVQPNGRILTGGNSFNMIGYSNIAITRMKPDGTMDNSFGTGGIATIPGGFFCDMALLPNGKIIVAGSGVGPTNVNNYIVYRLNKNGSLDNTFGTGGSVQIDIPYTEMICTDVAIQADNKIVLGGYAGGSGGYGNLLVVRLKANGILDNSFGTAGKFTLYLPGKHSGCQTLAIQSDGKIIAAGYIDTLIAYAFFRYDFAAIRLNSNGTPDLAFGTAGVVRADKGTTDMCNAAVVLSDGRIALAGYTNYLVPAGFATLCLMSNGTIDNTFGTAGWQFSDFFGGTAVCQGIVAESDDDLVLAGYAIISTPAGSNYSVALAKLSSTGIPDPGFGTGGVDTLLSGSSSLGCNSLALQADGKLVFAGYRYTGAHSAYLTGRCSNSLMRMESVALPQNDLRFTIFPNPVNSNILNVQLSSGIENEINISLIDINGQELANWQAIGPFSGNAFQLLLPEQLPNGTYLLRVSQNNTMHVQKIAVVR